MLCSFSGWEFFPTKKVDSSYPLNKSDLIRTAGHNSDTQNAFPGRAMSDKFLGFFSWQFLAGDDIIDVLKGAAIEPEHWHQYILYCLMGEQFLHTL